MRPLKERFEEKYIPEPNSGCWLWTAHCNQDGYGRIGRGRKMLLAHRVSWELNWGSIPDGFHVLHRCDNPFCVNPDHLFLGSHSDNMQDAVRKGRKNMPRGMDNHKAKLTEDQVREIRSADEKYIVLAEKFGVTSGMIGHIKCGRAWRHLP